MLTLSRGVRVSSSSLVLLDEVEKAHPDVFHTLLQVLDDGRLTDSQGRTVSFANCVIIMTSNLGAEHLLAAAAHGKAASPEVKAAVMGAAARHFRPEFLNRIDEIVVFDPLAPEQLIQVARLRAAELGARLLERNIVMGVTDEALAATVRASYEPAFGARPVRRFIDKAIGTQLSRMLVSGDLRDGQSVCVGADSQGFVYTVTELPPASGGAPQGDAEMLAATESGSGSGHDQSRAPNTPSAACMPSLSALGSGRARVFRDSSAPVSAAWHQGDDPIGDEWVDDDDNQPAPQRRRHEA